jgi:hypothetical protein
MGEKREGVVGNLETCSPWRGKTARGPAAAPRGGDGEWRNEFVSARDAPGGVYLLYGCSYAGESRTAGGELGNGRQRRGSAGAAVARASRGRGMRRHAQG